MSDAKVEAKRPRQGRSPAYPAIPLEKALTQARALYDAEGKYAAPLSSAFHAWGFGAKSSGGRQTLAALRYFGLIDVDGEGDGRKIKVSEAALRYLLDGREDATERKALLRKIAVAPSVHQDLFNQFPEGIKSDGSAKHFLMFDLGFNESGAAELLEEFKATAVFANLFKPATVEDNRGDKPERTSVMMTYEEAAEGVSRMAPSSAGGPAPGSEEELWLKGPLPGGSRYKIFVTGEMGPKEIGKLIKVLEAQKEMLSEDDGQ